jgi:UDPglucose 6-dehydrogenase
MASNRNNGKSIRLGIVGSGVVGTATGTGFIDKGFDVTFIDTDKNRVETLKQQGRKAFLPEEVNPADIDVFFVSVPTYTETYPNGLNYIRQSARTMGKWIAAKTEYTLVVLRSTIVPGTTEDLVIPIIEEVSGKKSGVDFDVCFNPEYLREISAVNDFKNPWVITIGTNNLRSQTILERVYSWAKCPVHRLSIKEAEMQKFVHNLCNANKISFFNEMRYVCDLLGLNSDKIFATVIESAECMWNPRYGTANLGPFNGACLPKDTSALLNFARERLDTDLKLLKAVIEVNNDLKQRTEIRDLLRRAEVN